MFKILLFCWVSLYLLLSVCSQQDEFTYIGFSDGRGNAKSESIWLDGLAELIDDSGVLRLTNMTREALGHAFYSAPLRFKDTVNGSVFSFSTTFVFSNVPEFSDLGGHGLAFTIAPSKDITGALPNQYLGLFNFSNIGDSSNHIFAVEFDSVKNMEFADINDNHVGINLNSMASIASVPAAYYADDGTKTDLILKDSGTYQAWIDYDGVEKVIIVTVAPSSSKPAFPILTFPLDLSPVLHDQMFVGFSASTGAAVSYHYLHGWSFKMNGAARSLNLSTLPTYPRHRWKSTTTIIAVSSSAAVALLIATAVAAAYLLYKKKKKSEEVIEPWELDYGPHRFSYQELKRATNGFRERELLGFGGFGKVYKGTLPESGIEVAIKRISRESSQGIREFLAEIASIGRLRHRNLVQLQGWCRRQDDLLLVYDYMPNGSLDKLLFVNRDGPSSQTQSPPRPRPRPLLSWAQRFRILRDVASALLYLHEEWENVVIHRDVKASNVLLDADLSGRLGDFGLAKLYKRGGNPSTTRVVGTLGYLAPELTRTGKATTSSDVYAFGALTLEVVCGRRPIEPKELPEKMMLVDWVWELWGHGLWPEAVDPRLGGSYDRKEVTVAIKVGLMCSQPAAAARPNIRDVVRYLDGGDDRAVPEVPFPPPDFETTRLGFDDFVPSSSLVAGGNECGPVGTGESGPYYSPISSRSSGELVTM